MGRFSIETMAYFAWGCFVQIGLRSDHPQNLRPRATVQGRVHEPTSLSERCWLVPPIYRCWCGLSPAFCDNRKLSGGWAKRRGKRRFSHPGLPSLIAMASSRGRPSPGIANAV